MRVSAFGMAMTGIDLTELKDKRQQVVLQLKELKADCKQLLTMLEDTSLVKPQKVPGEKADKTNQNYRDTLVMLAEKHNILPDHVESLYKYAKLHFECGNYGQVQQGGQMGAAEFLPIYRMLTQDPGSDTALAALWGKLAAEILLEKWEDAIADLNQVSFPSPLAFASAMPGSDLACPFFLPAAGGDRLASVPEPLDAAPAGNHPSCLWLTKRFAM